MSSVFSVGLVSIISLHYFIVRTPKLINNGKKIFILNEFKCKYIKFNIITETNCWPWVFRTLLIVNPEFSVLLGQSWVVTHLAW